MKKQRLKKWTETTAVYVCASMCFFSPDWLVGLLRCCGGGVLWFLIGLFFFFFSSSFFLFFFFKRHLVPPPSLLILKQVIPPLTANSVFAQPVLSDKQEDKSSACCLTNSGFPQSWSPCGHRTKGLNRKTKAWFGEGREKFSGAVYRW